jgi:hypothetical protein
MPAAGEKSRAVRIREQARVTNIIFFGMRSPPVLYDE